MTLVRYAAVGVLNTAVGYGVIFGAMLFGIGHVAANMIGYGCGFILSFSLNRRWTFRSNAELGRSFPRFALVTAAAYCSNLAAVRIAIEGMGINPYFGQLTGFGPYFLVGYVGSKYFAFKPGRWDRG